LFAHFEDVADLRPYGSHFRSESAEHLLAQAPDDPVAYAAADGASSTMRRVLALLDDDGKVDYHEVHEALVEAILAHVKFTDAIRRAMGRTVSPHDATYRVVHCHPSAASNYHPFAHDFSWARDDPLQTRK
jgi:hypothetical protein